MITAAKNPKVKNLMALMKKGRARKEQGVFVAEGRKMFLEAERNRIEEVYVSESFFSSLEEKGEVKKKLLLCNWQMLSDQLFKQVADTCTPQGILCVLRQYSYAKEDLLTRECPLLLLAEDIQDPGNLGTMIRSAEGAGADGIIMSRGTADIYNPKTIRSTMGSLYRLPFFYTEDLLETMEWLKERGVNIYAGHLEGSRNYEDEDYKKGSAFLIGNEAKGLKEETAKAAFSKIRIPMAGRVESLNAGAAASILLYEAARQRRNG